MSPSHSLDTHHQHSRMELKLYTSWWRLFDDDGRSFFHTFLGCVSPSPLLCLSVAVQCLPCLLPRVLFLVAVDGVVSRPSLLNLNFEDFFYKGGADNEQQPQRDKIEFCWKGSVAVTPQSASSSSSSSWCLFSSGKCLSPLTTFGSWFTTYSTRA